MLSPRDLLTECMDDLDDLCAMWCGEDYVKALELGLNALPLKEADLDLDLELETSVGDDSERFFDSSQPSTEHSAGISHPVSRSSARELFSKLVPTRSALSEQLAKSMEKIRETNRDLYEELMAIEDPCTTAVLFIQLCVKAARGMHHPMAERRREKIGAQLTEAEKWRLEQLSLQFTTHEQKVQVVKILLQAESKFASLDEAQNFGLRFPRFWSFMSKYHISDTAVRFRKFLSPRESRRKRVRTITSGQSSTLWM